MSDLVDRLVLQWYAQPACHVNVVIGHSSEINKVCLLCFYCQQKIFVEISHHGNMQRCSYWWYSFHQVFSQYSFLFDICIRIFSSCSFQFCMQYCLKILYSYFVPPCVQLHYITLFFPTNIGNCFFDRIDILHPRRKDLLYIHAVAKHVLHGLVHVRGKHGIVLEVVPQEVRYRTAEHDR